MQAIKEHKMKAIEFEQQQKRIKKALPFKIYKYSSEEITLELLKEARLISAKVVERYGDSYLPIFVRVQNEIDLRKSHQSYREKALQLLGDNAY